MRTLVHANVDGAPPRRLIALLTGSYSEPEDFVRQGFAAAVAEQGVAAEIVMAEMRAAWFADGSIVERIRDSIVIPARVRGFDRIWLGGISIGALATLSYAARHEDDLEGLVLLSPYPAARDVLREVDAAGGLSHWHPQIPIEGDLEREAWLWLASRGGSLPVFCYYGTQDRFAEGQRRMAQALEPAHVHERPGGHDWAAWRAFWNEFLVESRTTLQ
jgi:S-formylglutathione hydrolase FrmB